jgi:hypothetical protein
VGVCSECLTSAPSDLKCFNGCVGSLLPEGILTNLTKCGLLVYTSLEHVSSAASAR